MKKRRKFISLKPFSGEIFLRNRIFKIDNGHNIFVGFKERLKKHGFFINTIDVESKHPVYKYVYCDVPYPWELNSWRNLICSAEKNVLFCFESPIVNPFSHIRLLHKFFRKVYTWNDGLVDGRKYFKFHIPQLGSGLTTKPKSFGQKKFLVMVNAKRFSPTLFKLISPFKIDLYKERIKAIEFFHSSIPDKFSLYGRGWNKTNSLSIIEKIFGFRRYKTYRGEIKGNNKIEVLSGFKFCICFENTSAEGYITEKIFDCFKARCIPIYLGAPNIDSFIPKDCFISFRDFNDYSKLLTFLISISHEDYGNYIRNVEEFLESKKTLETWFEQGFEETFLESISNR